MRFTKVGAVVLALLSLAGCHTMRPVSLDDVSAMRPGQVRVTRTDRSVVVVYGPRLLENRLVGFVDGKYQVMPVADVQLVMMRQPAAGRTAALLAAGTIGAAALVFAISGTGDYVNPCSMASSECEPM